MSDANKGNVMLRITLIFSFIVPAVLLNSMGVIILNLTTIHKVSKSACGWLEAYQGGAVIVGAFVLASFIPSFGYKKSLLVGSILEAIGCFLMWKFASYGMTIVYFIFCGVGFAIMKTTVFALVGLIAKTPEKHASNISVLEGFFMITVLSGFWIYGFFMDNYFWTTTFLFLGVVCIINFFVILVTYIDESEVHSGSSEGEKSQVWDDMKNMLKLLYTPIIIIFVVIAFFYVFIEQGMNNWLPTFKTEILNIDPALSVRVASLFAGGLAAGRLVGAYIIKKVKWLYVLLGGLALAFILLAATIYFSQKVNLYGSVAHTWREVPYVAYLVPLIGFCIAPVYPTVCSLVLSSHPTRMQSSIAGLILFFSALGGTIGSNIIGRLFNLFGGLTAIKVPLIPIVIISLILIPYYFIVKKVQKKNAIIKKRAERKS